MLKHIFYDWGGLNAWLFLQINNFHTDWYDSVMNIGSMLGKYTLFPLYFLIIAGVAYWQTRENKIVPVHLNEQKKRWTITLLVLLFSYAASFAWVPNLKQFLMFPRPFMEFAEGVVQTVGPLESPYSSLPSGHSSFAMLMVAGLWPILSRKGKILAGLYAAWVGVSRMALGMHFPADVFWSMLFSLAVVVMIRRMVRDAWQLTKLGRGV